MFQFFFAAFVFLFEGVFGGVGVFGDGAQGFPVKKLLFEQFPAFRVELLEGFFYPVPIFLVD